VAANVVFPSGGANSTLPNPLAVFESLRRRGEERGKRRKGGEKEKKERDGRDGRSHPLPRYKCTLSDFSNPE